MLATIQLRRGNYAQFDPQMMVSGEPAAVLADDPSTPSGKAFYVCFQAGEVRRMVSIEDLQAMVSRGDFKGDKGDRGSDGKNGKDGVGIAGVFIDARNHVIVTLTNGETIDAGGILDVLEQINADEQARIQAEMEREAAEAERQSAEAARAAAEVVRVDAEQGRVLDEDIRNANEVTRVSDEATRVSNETDRVQAENARAANETNRNAVWAQLRPDVELATINANQAADNANATADNLVARAEAGEFDGQPGPQGPPGESGVTAPFDGMFSLYLDQDGNLYAAYPDQADGGNAVLLGKVKGPEGPQGPPGPPGIQGIQGPPGPTGSVDNNAPIEFADVLEQANLVSGDGIATLFGKQKKWNADMKPVAFSGSYIDLTDKPSIPSTPEDIGAYGPSNKPTPADIGAVGEDELATVAFSGSYNDLADRPTVPDSLPASNVTSVYSPTGVDPVNGTAVSSALKTLDVDAKGGTGKYIQSISETDGKIVAVEADMPASLPASGGNADTVGGKNLAYITDYNNLTNRPSLFSGNYNDLSNKPVIPTIPSSLPANGGNADTVDGKHASDLQNYNNLTNKPTLFSGNYNDLTNKPAMNRTINATVTASGWIGTSAPYTNTVGIAGVTATSIVDVSLQTSPTMEQVSACASAIIVDGGQSNGSITLMAMGDKPEIDIPIVAVIR